MILIDSHEDLAYNIRAYGRDYTRSAAEIRASEEGSAVIEQNGNTLLGWPDYQRGQVAVIFGTLFAAPKNRQGEDLDTQAYADFEQAHTIYSAQLDAYHRLADEHPDKFRLIRSKGELQAVMDRWKNEPLSPGPFPQMGEGEIELKDYFFGYVKKIN